MKYLIILLFLVGCGSDSGSGGGSAASKDLFSSWTSSDTGAVLNMEGFLFDANNNIDIAYSANSGCLCKLLIEGTQSSGTALLFSCVDYGPVDYCGGTESYDYTNVGGSMILCDGFGACEGYK